jgi:bifunctional UDP-N-acetylglucosamine pyrophosphorylase / glucosamine-1-phosphate N-acetyltransferase
MEKSNMTAKTHSPESQLISALILAAGKGTRMKSTTPKVLHHVMGQPMIEWVMEVVKCAGATDVTVVLSSEVKAFDRLLSEHKDLRVAIQSTQRGTGDAVAAAAKAYNGIVPPAWSISQLSRGEPSDAKWILICAGDTPAMNPQTIRDFISTSLKAHRKLSVLGMNVQDPKGYGRVVMTQDQFVSQIVEERDATAELREIKLCNTGIIFAEVHWLFKLLQDLTPNNAQSEYYLTDIFTASAQLGEPAFVFQTDAQDEFAGVNDRMQLEQLERAMIARKIKEFMAHGVTFHLPETIYLESHVIIEPDAKIYPGACLIGKSHVSRGCVVGAGAYIENSVLGAGVNVGPHAVLIDCRISAGESISPQAVYSNLKI